MNFQYYLVFECCGNEVSLGFSPKAGKHDKLCLACDTDDPETEVVRR